MSQPAEVYVHKGGITDIEKEATESMPDSEEKALAIVEGRKVARRRPVELDIGRVELQQQFVELRAKGWSLRKIERKLKVSKSTLANWDRALEEEIASLKAMELEALYESYFLAKESRIRVLGQQLRRVQQELKSRGLEDVSTEKLMELQLRYLDALQEEHVETRPLSEDEIAELKALR
jgi:transcriptional regulator with XRE-family HTH domain